MESGNELAREQIDALEGAILLEFGASWCGFCRAAQTLIEVAKAKHTRVRHVRIEDGRGRPLGRSFRVKLWPTLIFLRGGEEVARLVRPESEVAIEQALLRIDHPA
jgi:thioredoxin 1